MSMNPIHLSESATYPPVVEQVHSSVATAIYRTSHELSFYLRAFDKVPNARWVVVVALTSDARVRADDHSQRVRLIFTSDPGLPKPEEVVGWFESDPVKAVVTAMTGLEGNEGILLLFPAEWSGPTIETILDKARRWRSSPHSPNDDVYFNAN